MIQRLLQGAVFVLEAKGTPMFESKRKKKEEEARFNAMVEAAMVAFYDEYGWLSRSHSGGASKGMKKLEENVRRRMQSARDNCKNPSYMKSLDQDFSDAITGRRK